MAMAECALKCNNIKCRQSLARAESACITKYIFCMRCATGGFRSSPLCPACQTEMTHHVMTVSLAVTENYKSLILAGLPPLVIMDICSRALSFWSYQAAQELAFQQADAEAQRDKIQLVESRAATSIAEAREKIKVVESKLNSAQCALNAERQERSIAEDTIEEKNRQLRGIKLAYNNLRQNHALAQMSNRADIAPDRASVFPRMCNERYSAVAGPFSENGQVGTSNSGHHATINPFWRAKGPRAFSATQTPNRGTNSWEHQFC
ncbi:hypothetical protein BX661DRAFT_18024 [Kickxella alabastrina]|uniref:uncharacterized protein n=1 Tax=Kickxella alabastrina TaxID=61397 RepID=UPI002220EA37|nr:uncharacterized protein BX661DRAFT_18024 [Kickxella alabastrina]KAI7827833.1 hypothetical protein BX661DRAFT_18024 [Kickxella alabastrina]